MLKCACKCLSLRVIVAGIAFGVIGYLAGFIIWGVVLGEESAAHAQLWRTQDDPLMVVGMPLASLLLGLGVAVAYKVFSSAICVTSNARRGLVFGIVFWLSAGLGDSLFWYTLSPISSTLLIASLSDTFVGYVFGSVVIALILGDTVKACHAGESDNQ